MATVIQKRLRKLIEDSMVSNATHTIYANGTKYVVYHGRIEAKITPEGMITSRDILFQESLAVFK